MGSVLKALVNVGPDLITTISGLFDGSGETAEQPGHLAALVGKVAARFIPDEDEDRIGDLLISIGEAGELLKAAGRALKKAKKKAN